MTKKCRQSEFGRAVGISQQAVSGLIKRGVLSDGATAGAWLLEYCGNLREVAAGRLGNGGLDLATERAMLARVQREKIEMQNAVTRRELVPANLLVQIIAGSAPKVCGLLESIVPTLRRRAGYRAEDLDYISRTIADARNAIASLRLSDVLDGTPGAADADPDDDDGQDE